MPSGGIKKFRGEIQSTVSPLITEGCCEKTKAGRKVEIKCHFLTINRQFVGKDKVVKGRVKYLLQECYKPCCHEVSQLEKLFDRLNLHALLQLFICLSLISPSLHLTTICKALF